MRPLRKMLLLLQIVAFLSILFFSVRVVNGQEQLCLNNSNYTADDSFQYYLNSLLDSIATTKSSTLNDDGLFNASVSVPQSSDVVEVMVYCRGDQTLDACLSCLNIDAFEIRQMCPGYKQAVLFRDECTLKYSNGSMYGVVSDTLYWYWSCAAPATNWDVFKNVLKQLLDDLGSQAASGGLRKYAQDSRLVDLYTLYAAVMCSPHLSDQQCSDCLTHHQIVSGLAGTLTRFHFRDEDEVEVVSESPRYSLDTIKDATNNFSEANKIGEGGFGLVFLVRRNLREGNISSIINPLVKTGNTSGIMRWIRIGLLCVQEDPALRPTMASIILMLNRHSATPPVPKQPAS
ncbi:hypothetical protein MLD38_036897 [Melastoma candidum]|uniref:Uncharacterized protein n=1 Tax=Melastoma candidum TaxID=119954 RepID=A0ACB9LL15_9MYRT|nr:hypothetical protein MLD38_036897 [Melastoma candidum]